MRRGAYFSIPYRNSTFGFTMITIYGIKNCDTMKKAFDWLNVYKIKYTFHDYKQEGISKQKIEEWLKHAEITEIINLKSTTFRELPDADKASIQDKKKAIVLMMENTSMIKRPLIETSNGIFLGYKPEEWKGKL
jgi:arsenate reductase